MESGLASNTEGDVLQTTLQEIQQSTSPQISSRDVCVICLEEITEKAESLPCHHDNFDFSCLLSWLERATYCPLCKGQIKTLHYNWQSHEDYSIYIVQQPSTREDPRASYQNPWQFRRPQRPRPRASGRQVLPPDTRLDGRREVYRRQLYALHVGTNRLSHYRDLAPANFTRDHELVSRARAWIRRELRVFEFLNTMGQQGEAQGRRLRNAEYLLQFIIALLKTVDLQHGQAEDMLQEFLGRRNTRIFLHELRNWLRSPYSTIEEWDRHVQHGEANLVPVIQRN